MGCGSERMTPAWGVEANHPAARFRNVSYSPVWFSKISSKPCSACGEFSALVLEVGDVLTLDEHVGLADGAGLRVEFLPVHDEAGVGVVLGEVLAREAQHAASACCRVINQAHDAGFDEGVVIFDKQQIDHQADDARIQASMARIS